ncbi:Probable pectinesterase/pectinesterase inhibitor 21 [Striga hermonthica]|uniref:pectinesterase n=1 Tax=Striga hermonthica TaxID=68872 RepID=A0A9N7R685_STRHE|nr:Probable pectinesterase/pectinesterase inhibitor 21 [Striga hermonthica]
MALLKFLPIILLLSSFHFPSHGLTDRSQTLESMILKSCDEIDGRASCLSNIRSRIKSQDHVSVLKAALQNALDEARSATDRVTTFNTLSSSASHREQLALEDCRELLDFSVSELALSQVTQLIGNVLTLYSEMNHPPFEPAQKSNYGSYNSNRDYYEENVDFGDFPKWMSEGDKEMLASSPNRNMHVDSTVALDGSGDYRSIGQAIAEAPSHNVRRYVIHVKAGVYKENIDMKRKKTNIMLVGDGIGKTIITGNRNFKQGWTTFRTATFAVSGKGFIARDITFRNTAGPENHQGVALRVDSDQSTFYRCSMEGHQDTLYAHSLRQFYRECTVSGTIDFVFGNGAAVLQNCRILTRDPLPLQKVTITAQGRKDPRQATGFTIQDSYVYATRPTYLGRPWKMYSRTVFINTYMSPMVQPRGWLEWYGDFGLATLWYGEYKNYGPGASLLGRVRWPGYHKAISTICETTDYQRSCEEALVSSGAGNSTDPKDLIAAAFQAAIRKIGEAAERSSVLRAAQSDPRARAALDSCRELAGQASRDLERSYAKFNNFDITNVDDILVELKVWLSGAITNEETCLDGFEGVPGDADDRMRAALKSSMEMTSNALAMVAEISTFLETMGIQGFKSSRRRLLSSSVLGHDAELPEWMDFEWTQRRLMTEASFSPQQIKPNVVVAKDGTGKYRTINEALKDVPKNNNRTFVVYVKEGVYEEKVWINSSLTHLMIVGDGPTKTRITGRLNFIDGTGTYQTATVAVQADDFIARDIGFENSAGPEKHQAVALRVSADRAIFYNCHMDGYQDTLYVHTYRQFYRDCVISGTIDFIFGDAAAVFQGCTLLVRKPLDNQQNIVTAQGRKDVRQPTGLVIQNCTFRADPEYYPHRNKIKSYLGRPWKEYSRTIIMESFVDDFIQPQGWLPWNETFALNTLFYTEFNNRGPGAPKAQRAKWAGVKELPPARIQRFTAAEFLDGNRWIPPTRVPYAAGFIFPVPKEDPNIKYSPVVPEENKDLGSVIDKTSYVANKNNTGSGQAAAPPPPPPPPPVSMSAPEIAIPLDILPSASAPESSITASPSLSPVGNPSVGISQPIFGVSPFVLPVGGDSQSSGGDSFHSVGSDVASTPANSRSPSSALSNTRSSDVQQSLAPGVVQEGLAAAEAPVVAQGGDLAAAETPVVAQGGDLAAAAPTPATSTGSSSVPAASPAVSASGSVAATPESLDAFFDASPPS